MNRRDLMKFFAAGTVIVPLGASSAVAATIIEPPKIQPAQMILKPLDLGLVRKATMALEMEDGSVRTVRMKSFHGFGIIAEPSRFDVGIDFGSGLFGSPAMYPKGRLMMIAEPE